jgi:hypothetical protein
MPSHELNKIDILNCSIFKTTLCTFDSFLLSVFHVHPVSISKQRGRVSEACGVTHHWLSQNTKIRGPLQRPRQAARFPQVDLRLRVLTVGSSFFSNSRRTDCDRGANHSHPTRKRAVFLVLRLLQGRQEHHIHAFHPLPAVNLSLVSP